VSVKVSSSNCFCLSSIPLSVSGFKPLYKFFQSSSVYSVFQVLATSGCKSENRAIQSNCGRI